MPDNLRAHTALGQRLRQARLDAGLTGQKLTARLGPGWAQPKVSKLETGRQLPTEDELHAWATATAVQPDELLSLLDRARHEYSTYRTIYADEGGPVAFQDAIGAAERAATTIITYQPLIVPGILQTPDYAHHMLRLPGGPGDSGTNDDELARMVASRMRRAATLYEPGKSITLLMGEAALRNRFAPIDVMRNQLEHIARLAESLTTTTIGVIPFNRPQPVVLVTGWDQTDDLIEVETPLGALNISNPAEVARYDEYLHVMLDAADVGPAAARICRTIAAQLTES